MIVIYQHIVPRSCRLLAEYISPSISAQASHAEPVSVRMRSLACCISRNSRWPYAGECEAGSNAIRQRVSRWRPRWPPDRARIRVERLAGGRSRIAGGPLPTHPTRHFWRDLLEERAAIAEHDGGIRAPGPSAWLGAN